MSDEIAIFSEQERLEIQAQIEAAARREQMRPQGLPEKSQAAKRGLLPLWVNIGAAVVLAAGILLVLYLSRGETVEIRESGAMLGITERKIIQDIRSQTNKQIEEKEADIAAMNAKITEVDAELARLDSLEALTDEQKAAMEELHRQQDEYRSSLSTLQSERAQILADARAREAALNAKLEEQKGAMENLSAQSRAEIDAARAELAKLSGDQEKAALVEKQLNVYFGTAAKQVQAAQYREAGETVAALREFLNTPSFQSLRSIQARRESDLAAVAALQALVNEALKAPAATAAASAQPAQPTGPGAAETALQKQIAEQSAKLAELEKSLADREKTVEEQTAKAADLQKNVTDLQAQMQSQIAAKDRTISQQNQQIENLRSQNTANMDQIDTQQKTILRLQEELDRR
jgi:chromosome segregation ATPase